MARYAWLALVPLVVVSVYLLFLFLVQRSLLFPVPPHVAPGAVRAEQVRAHADGIEAQALFLPAFEPRGPSPALMFMHGNGELASYWTGEFDEARRWGMSVVLVEYPGYGGAPGSPSEASITKAVLALYDWAAGNQRIDSSRIVPYGRSLGGGAAVRLAVERPVAGLILESSFTSVTDFASRFMAPSFLIRDRFDSRRTLPRYRGPLLVLHGRHDAIVPIAHGRELASLVPGAQFAELECGHNDCPRDWDRIRRFLDDRGIGPGAR